MGNQPKTRKVAILRISPELVLDMLEAAQNGAWKNAQLTSARLPEDVSCVGASFSFAASCFELALSSESFEETPVGSLAKLLPGMEFRRVPEPDSKDAQPMAEPDPVAQAMLTALSAHYREPVLPMSRYCKAFALWMECIQKNVERNEFGHGYTYARYLRLIHMDILKSNLLARLLYAGEPLRTRMCPEHKGKWSGVPREEPACGCGLTGWLPEVAREDRAIAGPSTTEDRAIAGPSTTEGSA